MRDLSIWFEPKVTLVGRTTFVPPAHLPMQQLGGGTDPGADLAEFAGRLCYMSQANPSGRSNHEYIGNILKQGHGSVLEHASFSLLVEGVSRSLTHELVRHRMFAFSQLSQRYVDESHLAIVCPPAVRSGETAGFHRWRDHAVSACKAYVREVEARLVQFEGCPKREQRIRARESARSLLPNCVETKIVVTGDVRAWRTFLELRGSAHAEAEIRRLALEVFEVLATVSPAMFQDISATDDTLTVDHPKV
jgi:thymidylate synthase (FAD)